MKWTGSMKAVFCLVAFIHLSCNYQWMVNADTCVAQTLVITADNKMRLFIDGTEVTGLQHANSPGIADTVTLPCLPCVIAVSADNNGKNNGVLGSMMPIHIVTDASWKCICQNNVTEGWQEVNFNDTLWQDADEIHPHGVKPWQAVANVQPDALWINCKSPPEKTKYLFCRKRIGCDVPTTAPTSTAGPTSGPTSGPTAGPTSGPTSGPTAGPTSGPTAGPTSGPTAGPTSGPTAGPTSGPTAGPTSGPTAGPTSGPTAAPTPTTTTDGDAPTPAPAFEPQLCRGASGETGSSCITSCDGRANGDYQSCRGCQVYAACLNGILNDNLPCASGRYWDDKEKSCEEKSATCQECK